MSFKDNNFKNIEKKKKFANLNVQNFRDIIFIITVKLKEKKIFPFFERLKLVDFIIYYCIYCIKNSHKNLILRIK